MPRELLSQNMPFDMWLVVWWLVHRHHVSESRAGQATFLPVKTKFGPGWIAHLVRTRSRKVKVAGLIPVQSTYKYKSEPRNA